MYWRTDGGWEAPVIVMISCGGYKPGLGPFHAQSMAGNRRPDPRGGSLYALPCGGCGGTLNAAFESERPTLFFYPKNLLNNRELALELHAEEPVAARRERPGLSGRVGILPSSPGAIPPSTAAGGGGSGRSGGRGEILDLRTLRPWDKAAVLASVKRAAD